MKIVCISILCITIIGISGCSSTKRLCPVAEFETYNNRNPVNSWCAQYFKDSSKIYAAGDAVRPTSRGQSMILTIAQSMAIQNLAKKVSEFQNSVSYMVQKNDKNQGSSGRSIKMKFDVELVGVQTVIRTCVEADGNFHCYSVVEMPKPAMVKAVKAELKRKLKDDIGRYNKLVQSKDFKNRVERL